MKVTADQVRRIAGTRAMPKYAKGIAAGMSKYGAHLNVRATAVDLAHIAVETGGYRSLEENLNYSAKRLRQVWPRRFKTNAQANKYARNPKALANYVYGGRMGNKGISGAGWKYRGMGPPQLTGRNNYKRFGEVAGFDLVNNPEMMLDVDKGMAVSIAFAEAAQIHRFAVMGGDGLRRSRKAWNGGYHGYDQFLKYYRKAMKILGARDVSNPTRKPPKHPDPLLMEYQRKLAQLAEATNDAAFDPGKADGWNGKKTAAAVIASQKMNKSLWAAAVRAKAQGKLGPRTRANIDRLLAKYTPRPAPLAPAPKAAVERRPLPRVETTPKPAYAPPPKPTRPKTPPKSKSWWKVW